MNAKNIKQTGILYIVPTPIGNLNDISYRAINILQHVDLIAAENIFHSQILLKHYNILTRTTSLNKDNEKIKSKTLIIQLKNKKNIALISNSGTPLINDPGFYLINECYNHIIKIVPIPGPCAAITALIASGLPANRFCYEGFLPSKQNSRCKILNQIKEEQRTIIFFEVTHRIIESITDIINILGPKRIITFAKELTKKWEIIQKNTSYNILIWLKQNYTYKKGEIVIIISGYNNKNTNLISDAVLKTLKILKTHLSFNKAIKITAGIYKLPKNYLYNYAINNTISKNNDIH
ncbi:putative tetrapyrrole methylase [Buchnera aphidicola str. Bp (Baizongia pistaciae)]|uniref:Ribosomal RNA small subunit methyltransferase I n=1 Tax=Buchnera aphidicola subsp. Baizongia pistaciae (strain Bp) TaxID=224915 RepID=RSMI_BUCBP|nr:16S rRNA (cytidine(1402)-2'-O)-methyltransferase [Buchnera aphidicola]Q89AY5.1 RecName: Full=Ribosomal RNA small subunit methyltransferase I; AltName: Full=16S rRNA 2'-O-ribose C1402 methyltransferase; AltName: Full=rRNA (cytidine-2'-O-)-methyltransferase RsmI [Buchnera aphidicola str. Bp (Baizongia pistaciae)]AAO26820.1 putative tetrapyrrole methylase [Buchnera aphidicola str. Bp (Baizongia pistaciae)]